MHDASQAAWSSIEQVQKGSWWEQAFYSSGESLTVIWRQWQNSKFEVFCECAFQPNWKKTRFFSSNRSELLVKWVFTCPPLLLETGHWPPSSTPARAHQKFWTQISGLDLSVRSLAQGKSDYSSYCQTSPEYSNTNYSLAVSWHDFVFIWLYSLWSQRTGGVSASSFFSFPFALNIILLLSQGRRRLAEGQECLSKETNETSGNYEAGQQNQWGLQDGVRFPGSSGDGGI